MRREESQLVYKWRSFRKRKSWPLVYTLVCTRWNAIKTLSNRMPDAIALATKIRRPLLSASCPRPWRVSSTPFYFQVCPFPRLASPNRPFFSHSILLHLLHFLTFEIWIDPIVVVSSFAFSSLNIKSNHKKWFHLIVYN